MPRREDPLKGLKMGTGDYASRQRAYMRGVIRGDITCCKWVRLAVERAIRDHRSPPTGPSGQAYRFSAKRADRACRFFERLPAQGGSSRMTLMDWQAFLMRELMGWVSTNAEGQVVRRYQHALVSMGRKNGKSATAAAIALYCWLGEPLDEDGRIKQGSNSAYFAASHRDQAYETYNIAKEIAKRGGLERLGMKVNDHGMKLIGDFHGELKPISKDSGKGSLDGKNPGCAIIDEYHAHTDTDVYSAMDMGMGNRPQPLLLVISTAGKDPVSSPLKPEQEAAEMVLEGKASREDSFAMIFTSDEGDDLYDESVWPKSQPSMKAGVSRIEYMRSKAEAAKIITSAVFYFEVKLLNRWASMASGFFDMSALIECGGTRPRLSFDDLDPAKPAYLGFDLAKNNDLTAISAVQVDRSGEVADRITAATVCFLPDALLAMDNGVQGRFYREMRSTGTLDMITTPGASTDFVAIREFLTGLCGRLNVVGIGGDGMQSNQMIDELQSRFSAVEIHQQTASPKVFSEPLQTLELAILQRRFEWSGSDFLKWQYGNLVAEEKETSASKILTVTRPSRKAKIDAPVSVLNALAVALNMNRAEPEEQSFFIDLNAI